MYFKTIKKGTKKSESLISNYNYHINRFGCVDLAQAYKTASTAKWRAWRDIQSLCDSMSGHGLTVLGHSCHNYSAAFLATENGVEKLFYFTACNSYEIEI